MPHPHRHLFTADGTEAPRPLSFFRGQADPAVPVAVGVVFPLLGEKLQGTPEAAGPLVFQGLFDGRIGHLAGKQIRLPPQLGGGMSVGMGHQSILVQGGKPPVHGRVGGQAGLQRMDMGRQVPEAVLDPVEAGIGPEQRKVGRPDMGGDEHRPGADIQGDFQQIPGVQPQDGPAVGMKVAHLLQPQGQGLRLLKAGEKNQAVHLAHPTVPFINRADFPRDHKADRDLPARRQAVQAAAVLPQAIEALLGGDQLLCQLLPPAGVGEIAGAHHLDPLAPGPPIQQLRDENPAGGAGKVGMDMQIGNKHERRLLFDQYTPFFDIWPWQYSGRA